MEKLLWLDLEMSGLDVEKEVIIEVAAIITDLNFEELANYHAIVKQPQHYIDNMDDWNREHHGKSGLIDLIPTGKGEAAVEEELNVLLNHHYQRHERVVLAGNTISQDRLFIRKYWKNLEARLHYRMLDVTGWKIIFGAKYDRKYEKKETHRALDDIRESIEELRYYCEFISID